MRKSIDLINFIEQKSGFIKIVKVSKKIIVALEKPLQLFGECVVLMCLV